MKSQSTKEILVYGSNSDHWTSIILDRCNDIDIVTMPQGQSKSASLANIRGLVGWKFPAGLFRQMPNLQWIQFISVAVDEWAGNSAISPDVIVTNTKGLYGDSVADYIIWAILTMTRRFDVVIANQRKRRWRQTSGPSLGGKTIGILGVGNVGKSLAERTRVFGMKTVGLVSGNTGNSQTPPFDQVVPIRDLGQIIDEFDFLAICVPLTDTTRNIVDAELIGKMKSGAYLINAARGEVVDESAIAKALRNGKLAGAALDVFRQEPLGRLSALWKTNNLLVTPHVAAITDDYQERVGNLICENVSRFVSGDELLNIVDPNKGY